ncbi:hypothetical protein [Pararhizobium sp. A13]|uniref:hypothetical protein n=1 Tax=Pararhizobium sp. A13 TaxID=3133975 RepID=UPI00324BC303
MPAAIVFNTAITLETTGHTNRHVDRNDLFGKQLISALRESQVDTSHVIVSGRPTTLAFVKLEEPEALL